ncbi:hypothetical protein DM02DRAFT_378534 [Periconia macrospinosa]|uniref:Uncharacterized protein n=1 Tax=Periconia macrospinosa TaxID=97972 RepID=A0A2V1E8J3_9PLEO|nr:hypothetical protein DM02DRAFT_378534 [Periconia macrospinosa]
MRCRAALVPIARHGVVMVSLDCVLNTLSLSLYTVVATPPCKSTFPVFFRMQQSLGTTIATSQSLPPIRTAMARSHYATQSVAGGLVVVGFEAMPRDKNAIMEWPN